MEEEDEYDYDIYDNGADSGFGGDDDAATIPPSPPSGGNPENLTPPPSVNPADKDEETEEEFEVVPGSIFQCPAPGFYPHEDNCREFYVCQGGNR